MRRVTVLSDCGIELCEKIEDAPGVAVYCDPPYVEKGCSYIHDFDEADHRRLAAALGRLERTRVVVSYYDHPMVREMYPPARWTWIDCTTTKALVNQGMRDRTGAVSAPEVLIVNGPKVTGGGLFA